MQRHKTYIMWFAIGLLSLTLIGGVMAYHFSSDQIDNQFKSAEAKVYLNEKFNPNDQWVPGEEKQKEVRFGNEGKVDAVLRVKFTPVLKCSDGTEDETAAQGFMLNFSAEFAQEWEQQGDWYYYKKVLAPSEITGITLQSVTISDQIGNDEHGIKADYSGATYEVRIESELLQASLASEIATKESWEKIPTVSGSQVIWQ